MPSTPPPRKMIVASNTEVVATETRTIDAGVFLMARFNQRGRIAMQLRALRTADNIDAHRMISDSLPPVVASVMPADQLEFIRKRLLKLPEPERPRLSKRDGLGAIGICLLSFLSTFPIVIPFILIGDARLALRLSPMPLPSQCYSCADMRLGVTPGIDRGSRGWRWSASVRFWSALP